MNSDNGQRSGDAHMSDGEMSAEGRHIAGTPAEAATGGGIVLTMLADADAVVAAMEGDDGALPVMADGGAPEPAA